MSRGAKAISGVVALLAMGGMCCTSAAGDPRYLDGQIIVDPDNPAWLARYAVGGDQVPFFMAGPGDPEGFLYRGSRITDGTRDGDQVGWTNGSGVTNNGVSGGTWDLVMSGVEPKVFGPTLSAPADLATVVEIGMSSTDTNTSGKFFWKVEGDADFSAQRSQAFTILSDGQIHSYRLDLSRNSDWTDTITGLRLDPVASSHGGDVAIDFVRLHAFLRLGDVNLDGGLNGLDVGPFVTVLLDGLYQVEADMNLDGDVNGLDVDPFVATVVGGGTQPVTEPSTLLLCIITLGLFGGWRKWGG